MSALTPEEYQAHLSVATVGLPVIQVDVVDERGVERVHAVVAEVVRLNLPSWKTQEELRALLAEDWPHLRSDATALPERLEIARRTAGLAELLQQSQSLAHQVNEAFKVDDEEVRIRLGNMRTNLLRLLEGL